MRRFGRSEVDWSTRRAEGYGKVGRQQGTRRMRVRAFKDGKLHGSAKGSN